MEFEKVLKKAIGDAEKFAVESTGVATKSDILSVAIVCVVSIAIGIWLVSLMVMGG